MMEYRELLLTELTLELFRCFERYQKVERCWRKEAGNWVLKDIAFVEQWGEADYAYLVKCLQNTLKTGGSVTGAFDEAGKLVGFASVESRRFGCRKQYCQLSSLHVSCESRGRGIGSRLLACASAAGRRLGVEKLYISAHSSEETQAFYHAKGCVEAEEYEPALHAAEPCDCQLELAICGDQNRV